MNRLRKFDITSTLVPWWMREPLSQISLRSPFFTSAR